MKRPICLLLGILLCVPSTTLAASSQKRDLFGLGLLGAALWAAVNSARAGMVTERGTTSFPAPGETVEARPGEAMAATFNYDEVKVIHTEPGFMLPAVVEQGRKSVTAYLMQNSKYCVPAADACWADKDNDGDLDKAGYPRGSSKVEDVPYETGVQLLEASSDGFRSELVYLGASAGVLRLAYREYVNDMARPAFAQELTYDLSSSGPTTIAFQDQVFEILEAGNMRVQYQLLEANQ